MNVVVVTDQLNNALLPIKKRTAQKRSWVYNPGLAGNIKELSDSDIDTMASKVMKRLKAVNGGTAKGIQVSSLIRVIIDETLPSQYLRPVKKRLGRRQKPIVTRRLTTGYPRPPHPPHV